MLSPCEGEDRAGAEPAQELHPGEPESQRETSTGGTGDHRMWPRGNEASAEEERQDFLKDLATDSLRIL